MISLEMIDLKKILIIDDDVDIGNMLEEALKKEKFEVFRAYSGTEGMIQHERVKPDVVLLDLMIPGIRGEKVLPRIKRTPVIIISAKADVDNKVKLLLDGAYDYIQKPFEMKELLARIEVALRNAPLIAAAGIIKYEDITLNTDTRECTIGKFSVKLTRTEYAILKTMIQNGTQIISKSLLLDKISSDTPDCTESSLKIHVSNLRKKLRDAGEKDYIEAVWGIGFRMIKSEEEKS